MCHFGCGSSDDDTGLALEIFLGLLRESASPPSGSRAVIELPPLLSTRKEKIKLAPIKVAYRISGLVCGKDPREAMTASMRMPMVVGSEMAILNVSVLVELFFRLRRRKGCCR